VSGYLNKLSHRLFQIYPTRILPSILTLQ